MLYISLVLQLVYIWQSKGYFTIILYLFTSPLEPFKFVPQLGKGNKQGCEINLKNAIQNVYVFLSRRGVVLRKTPGPSIMHLSMTSSFRKDAQVRTGKQLGLALATVLFDVHEYLSYNLQ